MHRQLVLLMPVLLVALSGCGGGGAGQDVPFETSVIDLSNDGVNGFGFGSGPEASKENKRWQTFIAGDHPVVTGVEVKVKRFEEGTFTTVRVELYETDAAGRPTGGPLAAGFIPPGWIGTDFTVVQTTLRYDGLEAGQEYAVLLTQETLSGAHYQWCVEGGLSNELHFGKYQDSSWVDESGLGDGWLKVHVASTEPPAPERIYLYAGPLHTGALRYVYPDARTGADILAADRPLSMADKTFHAFISISAADSIANLPETFGFPSDVPIVSALDETKVIADQWSDLLDGSIDIPLNDALGLAGPWLWWSGSNADGTYDTVYNCGGWTTVSFGMVGRTDDAGAPWIHATSATGGTERYVLGIAY